MQNKSNNPTVYLFRHAHEKYNKELVNKQDHNQPSISQMYWGGIWKTGRTPLVPMIRDENAPRRGYSSWSYQKALEEGLLPLYDGTRRFQQDNARIHTSESSMAWLAARGIELLEWPPLSPDLSPIENLWAIVKRQLRRKHPNLHKLKDNITDRAFFMECVKQVWQEVPQEQIRRLIESLPKRLRAVIRARGWYTKY